jgi:hypothetical protein
VSEDGRADEIRCDAVPEIAGIRSIPFDDAQGSRRLRIIRLLHFDGAIRAFHSNALFQAHGPAPLSPEDRGAEL